MVKKHTHYAPSIGFISNLVRQSGKAIISSHSLAECYATLTLSSLEYTTGPEEAWELIEKNILGMFQIVELGVSDYRLAIQRCKEYGLRHGAVYDALIFQAALKAKAKKLVTWNLKHFLRLGDEFEVVTPETF